MRWTLLVDAVGRPGFENMRVDSALLHQARADRAFLRLYRWSPPCLSFGRNEPARTRYDTALIRDLELDTVRRPTGGRAVWHDAEVTYAVAAPIALFGSLAASYIQIHTMLVNALRRLGAAVTLAPQPETRTGLAGGACFATPVGGEIVHGNRKLVGSAQVREGNALLQHGSILLEDGQDIVARVTRGPSARTAATALSAVLGRPTSFEEVAATVISEAQRAWSGTWSDDVAATRATAANRYAEPAWTWRR